MSDKDRDDKQFRRVISDPKETAIDHSGRRRLAINAETGEPIEGPIGETILTQDESRHANSDIAFEGQSQGGVSDINFAGESGDKQGEASDLKFDADPESAGTDIVLDGDLDNEGINSHLRFKEGDVSSSAGGAYSFAEAELRGLKSQMQTLAGDLRRTKALHDATQLSEELAGRIGQVKSEVKNIRAETERLNEARKALK